MDEYVALLTEVTSAAPAPVDEYVAPLAEVASVDEYVAPLSEVTSVAPAPVASRCRGDRRLLGEVAELVSNVEAHAGD